MFQFYFLKYISGMIWMVMPVWLKWVIKILICIPESDNDTEMKATWFSITNETILNMLVRILIDRNVFVNKGSKSMLKPYFIYKICLYWFFLKEKSKTPAF